MLGLVRTPEDIIYHNVVQFQVIKNPITDHLPTGSKKIGMSFHAEGCVDPRTLVPPEDPVVLVVGAMAHGSVSMSLVSLNKMSLVIRRPAFCICVNKDADQLRGNREADQRLCFRYRDSTIPLLPKYENSSLQPSCVVVQSGLCGS